MQVLSCKKEETPYTITGTLRENCGAPPLAGAYLELFQDVTPGGMSKSQTLYTNTDNNGNFSFTYKNNTSIPLSLFYGTASTSHKILTAIPAEKNIDLGDVYTNNKSYLYVKINFNTPHGINDTIYYAILPSSGPKKFAGPFFSVLLDSFLISRGHFTGGEVGYTGYEQGELIWGLGYSDMQTALNSMRPDISNYNYVTFRYRGCGYKDTAYINVQ
ncbi:MAG: hypothetical protein K0S44_1588 [Bacteroidetes bacterium]|nr:hypothetical protein [Bacteroidota bacterium]